MKSSQRESYIDVVRGLAIIFVVLGHLGMPAFAHSFIYGFHMPLFFILSGYLYSSSKQTNVPFLQYTHIKARAYLFPYVILALVNFFANLLMEKVQLSPSDLWISSKSHLYWLLLTNDAYGISPNCEALWLLPCFFLVSVGFYLIQKQSTLVRSALMFVLCLLQAIFIVGNVQLPWHLNILPVCILFVYVGWFIRHYKLLDRPFYVFAVLLILGVTGSILNPVYLDLNHMSFGNLPLCLCGAIGMSYSILYICKHWLIKSFLLELYGRNTLPIMGLHMLLSSLILLVLNRIPLFAAYGYHWWLNAALILLLFIPVCLLPEKLHR